MVDAAANKKRRRRCTPTDDAFAALPEHLLCEVLTRVGNAKDLFMLAVTCRRWQRRFTDPAFLRGLCPAQGEGHAARLLGFLSQKKKKTEHQDTSSVLAPAFIPAPGSPLGTTTSAFIANDDGAKPLAARRGIVLMTRLGARTSEQTISLLLGICNPITGERHALPPLEWGRGRDGSNNDTMHGCAIITAADSEAGLDGKQPPPSSSSFTFSQLLLIVWTGGYCGQLVLHSYSAATRSWSMPVICPDDTHHHHIFVVRCCDDARSAVLHRGSAHWLCVHNRECVRNGGGDDNLYKLSVKAGTRRVSLAKLPGVRGGGKPCLCVTGEGKLAVVSVYMSHVTVWTQQGGDDTHEQAAWPRTAAFIVPAVPSYPYLPLSSYEGFHFSRGAMLLVHMQSGIVFILDLEKKVMEKVMDCPMLPLRDGKHLIKPTPVPYEMDLVDFFVLQLGGLCRGPRKYYLRSRTVVTR